MKSVKFLIAIGIISGALAVPPPTPLPTAQNGEWGKSSRPSLEEGRGFVECDGRGYSGPKGVATVGLNQRAYDAHKCPVNH